MRARSEREHDGLRGSSIPRGPFAVDKIALAELERIHLEPIAFTGRDGITRYVKLNGRLIFEHLPQLTAEEHHAHLRAIGQLVGLSCFDSRGNRVDPAEVLRILPEDNLKVIHLTRQVVSRIQELRDRLASITFAGRN